MVNLGYVAGGAEKSVKFIREGLIARGHEVLVVSTDKDLAGRESFADVVVPQIAGSRLKRLASYAWYESGRRMLEAAIRGFGADVVHLHTIGEFGPAVFWGLAGVPALLTAHGPEEFIRPLLVWQLPASDFRTESFQWADLKALGRLRYAYQRFGQRPLYLFGARRHLRLILAPSTFMAHLIEREVPGVALRRLYNGIDLPSAVPLPDQPLVLFVGRLEWFKGLDKLLHAMRRIVAVVPEASLLVVGDGSKRRDLEALSEELGLGESVRFAGWVGPSDTAEHYAAARVVAVPSLGPETLSMVTIEAMAVGRPVVATNVGGLPELVEDSVTGSLVEPGDVCGLADALAAILTDGELALRMSVAARRASEVFGAERFLDALERTYCELTRSS